MPAKRLTKADVTFAVVTELEEDEGVVSGCIEADDCETVDELLDCADYNIRRFSPWSRRDTHIVARLAGLQGECYLGARDHYSVSAFMMHFDQVCAKALADLQRKVDALYPLIHVEVPDVA